MICTVCVSVCFLMYKNIYNLFSICDETFVSSQYKAKLQRFCISGEKPCALQSNSKYYTHNTTVSLHSSLLQGFQLWLCREILKVDEEGVKMPPTEPKRGWRYPLERGNMGSPVTPWTFPHNSYLWRKATTTTLGNNQPLLSLSWTWQHPMTYAHIKLNISAAGHLRSYCSKLAADHLHSQQIEIWIL